MGSVTLYRRIEAAAATVRPVVVVKTLTMWPFYAIGWLAGRVARVVWLGLVWVWASLRVGVETGWGNAA